MELANRAVGFFAPSKVATNVLPVAALIASQREEQGKEVQARLATRRTRRESLPARFCGLHRAVVAPVSAVAGIVVANRRTS
jgi:hypothetical protein